MPAAANRNRIEPTGAGKGTQPSPRPPGDLPAGDPTGSVDAMLVTVIVACFVPVGLLAIADHGGGLVAVIIAYGALVLITAALTTLLVRVMGQPGD